MTRSVNDELYDKRENDVVFTYTARKGEHLARLYEFALNETLSY